MSGIVGIVHFDEQPIERELMAALTASMRYRGPDGDHVRVEGRVGLGVAELASCGGPRDCLSSDGIVHVVADARVDGRQELEATLESASGRKLRDAGAAELILRAYLAWGDDAVVHLLGDFCFAIWDGRARRLVCARDHFGVKPFYYAEWPGGVVFGNTLRALRRHPAVSSELYRPALAEFLLFELNSDLETTAFAGVRRLAPASVGVWTDGRRCVRRYWDLPVTTPAGAGTRDWIEGFQDVLRAAVADRLDGDRVAVSMSGGLDSTTVATLAHRALMRRGRPFELHCHTLVYELLIPDLEGHFAGLVAAALGVPIHYLRRDDYRLFERWETLPVAPEPVDHVLDALDYDFERAMAGNAYVVLTGYGGDPLLLPFRGYFLGLLSELRFWRAARYVFGSLRRTGRLPPLGLHTRWSRRCLRRTWRQEYPAWLDPDLERELDLEERWRWWVLERFATHPHPRHPEAHRHLSSVEWTTLFERWNPGARGTHVEYRHPFFDLRLVEYVFAVPPVPWCLDKRLLREAARGVLPEPVRTRAKTPLVAYPRHPVEPSVHHHWQELAGRCPEISGFVRTGAVGDEIRRLEAASGTLPLASELLRPCNLAHWLAMCDNI